MQGTPGRIVLGFIAAAIAVVSVHQGIIYAMTVGGLIRGTPWSMLPPVPPFGVPKLINDIFWGGLWGALFGVVHERLPGGALWLKGLIYGLLIVVFSNWLLLPLIKGRLFGQPNQVLFANFEPQRMLIGIVILAGFGLATGVIYGLLRREA